MPNPPVLPIGEVARRLGCEPWHIRRLIARGLLPEPGRVATYRVFREADLPRIQAAIARAGYLPRDRVGAAG
jgi:DNA-binding transcriptional MerR regulator